MILDEALLDCASRLDLDVRLEIGDVEQQVRSLLGDDDDPGRLECVVDVFGLGAIEWGIVVEPPGTRVFDVGTDDYLAALRHGTGCVPIHICKDRLLRAPSAADVVPLRGDFLKVFGDDDLDPDWRQLAEPQGARAALDRLRELYAVAAGTGLDGYAQWVETRVDELRVVVWLLRAQALIDGTSGSTDPSGRRRRASTAVDDFLRGQDVGTPVPAGAYS